MVIRDWWEQREGERGFEAALVRNSKGCRIHFLDVIISAVGWVLANQKRTEIKEVLRLHERLRQVAFRSVFRARFFHVPVDVFRESRNRREISRADSFESVISEAKVIFEIHAPLEIADRLSEKAHDEH